MFYFLCQAVLAPGMWNECEGREWRLFQENLTWSNAERMCQSYGGHLADLEDSQSRTTCAKIALQTCFRDGPQVDVAYVGLTNIFDISTYRWVRDNSMAIFRSSEFGSLQFRRDSQHCSAFMETESLKLVDCSLEYPFICERPICEQS